MEEELDEAKGEKGDANPLDGEREKFDKDLDGAPDGGDKDKDDPDVQEAHCGKRNDDKVELRPYKENKVNLKELIEKVLKNNERIMEKLKDK